MIKTSNKKVSSNNLNNSSGITLVALAITIIVLLILSAVVLKLSVGENGVIGRAKDSAKRYNEAQDNEIGIYNNLSSEYDKIITGDWWNEGGSSNPGGTTTPGGDKPDNPNPPTGSSNLTGEEKDKLEDNGIKELGKDEITNDNLKDNENIKGVITGEVPIPTGSDYVEGTKETGVVVEFGDGSQFVWVPVPNIDEMAVLQSGSTTDYQGVLYDFSGTTATKRKIVAIGSESGYREPDVLKSLNYDAKISNLAIINTILGTEYASNNETAVSQFKVDLQTDYNEMVESVKKYKGFFVGRYEISLDTSKKAHSKVGILPATAEENSGNTWYGLYAYQKKMASDNGYSSVKSHMIWGSAYDAMLRWGLTGADATKVSSTGNAAHDLSSAYETGKETIAGKVDRINNIYDLEGNGYEWTAETYIGSSRSTRGGNYCFSRGLPSAHGNNGSPSVTSAGNSSRPMIYIK